MPGGALDRIHPLCERRFMAGLPIKPLHFRVFRVLTTFRGNSYRGF